MESVQPLKINSRETELYQWLQTTCGLMNPILQPMIGDASFRRYFRVLTQDGSFVVMDSPPLLENCQSYIHIAHAIRQLNLYAPEVFHANVESGYLLLSDFGDATYLKSLNSQNVDRLYGAALDALGILQTSTYPAPPFTKDFMLKEWGWHKEWFLNKLLGLFPSAIIERDLDDCYAQIVSSATHQPRVFMHRDFHSANLMLLPTNEVGILDFQDAFIGPITYDLASLLRDCYIDWPDEWVQRWVNYYWQSLTANDVLNAIDQTTFMRWFDWMGLQRHLKALLTFARKQVRDKQPHYLKHIPRTLNYIINVSSRYPELAPLHAYFSQTVSESITEAQLCVR